MFSSGKFLSPIVTAGLPAPGCAAGRAPAVVAAKAEPATTTAAMKVAVPRDESDVLMIPPESYLSSVNPINKHRIDVNAAAGEPHGRPWTAPERSAARAAVDLELREVSKRYAGQAEPAIASLSLH